MADPWASATANYSFRFFSPEQIDRILREGAKRGRAGSHDAIERILKHEPGLERAALWRQIRRLKRSPHGKLFERTKWNPEDEEILRKGYEGGWKEKRERVRELLRRHPRWQPHTIWRRAAKLGLARKTLKKDRQCSRQPWTDSDDRTLLGLAGYKSARFIGKLLRRSEAAILYRLTLLGKSSRVHLEGYARRTLARELHLGIRTIQRLIVEGLLEVRDPRITRKSLEDACKAGWLTLSMRGQQPAIEGTQPAPREEGDVSAPSNDSTSHSPSNSAKPPRSSRARRIWADVARELNVEPKVIDQLICRGKVKLFDPRVTEKSLTKFCARFGAVIRTDFLDAETRDWLVDSMSLVRGTGKETALGLEASRKHAHAVRTCEHCGRTIRGNAFFRHMKRCFVENSTNS
jgi:hypothetical protein